jgi:outer membrane protein OmpU
MNIKKIGLTALAGSLVATSAYAGELALSGSATLTWADYSGTSTTSATKSAADSNWGMDQDMTASGSGELDNGWTVSLSHLLAASGATSNTSSITIDMGDAGTLVYSDASVGGGLNALDDITPTAWEEATDGTEDENQAGMPTGNGFSYALPAIAGASVSIAYSDNLSAGTSTNDGAVASGGTDNGSSHAVGITYPVSDTGLTIYGGIGKESQADGFDIDHDTVGFKYTFGALSIGAQRNNEDDSAASSPVDLETTIFGVSYLINENLSVSYGSHSTTKPSSTDQEIDSVQAAYSMGGISVKVQNTQGEGIGNTAGKTSEKNEVSISFAF